MDFDDELKPFYFQYENHIICGKEIRPITDDYVENYPAVADRFFTRYYYIKSESEFAPYSVLFHSNRVCLICLAPEHPALSVGVKEISYDIGNADRSKNIVKGKGKKGGMVLQADSTLALLTTFDGKEYKVPACVRGKLVEVNIELVNEPKHLKNVLESEQYLAVILPKPENCEEIKAGLMTQIEYNKYLKSIELNNQMFKQI